MTTLIYNGDGDYLGCEGKEKKLSYWIRFGEVIKQNYLYKGYHYYIGEKNIVVVFTVFQWDKEELARRKRNGFLWIKEYVLEGDKQ